MPIYEYECYDCHHIQEEIHPFSGPTEPIRCKQCNSSKIYKIISKPYIKFVGEWQTNEVRNIPSDNK